MDGWMGWDGKGVEESRRSRRAALKFPWEPHQTIVPLRFGVRWRSASRRATKGTTRKATKAVHYRTLAMAQRSSLT